MANKSAKKIIPILEEVIEIVGTSRLLLGEIRLYLHMTNGNWYKVKYGEIPISDSLSVVLAWICLRRGYKRKLSYFKPETYTKFDNDLEKHGFEMFTQKKTGD